MHVWISCSCGTGSTLESLIQVSSVVSTFLQQQAAASDCQKLWCVHGSPVETVGEYKYPVTILDSQLRFCSDTEGIKQRMFLSQLLFCQQEQIYLLSLSRSMHLYCIAAFYCSCVTFNVPLIAPRGYKCLSDCDYTGTGNLNINIFLAKRQKNSCSKQTLTVTDMFC